MVATDNRGAGPPVATDGAGACSCPSRDGDGSPSLESQAYASAGSKAGHVNCKSGSELKELFLKFFHNVFLFSMNDEVVHTGFYKMAHYLFAIGCCKR